MTKAAFLALLMITVSISPGFSQRLYNSNRSLRPVRISRNGNARENLCYSCSSNSLTNLNCQRVGINTTTKICPSTDNNNNDNTCVVYVQLLPNDSNTKHVTRGCIADTGSCDALNRQSNAMASLLSCVECQGDRCNFGNGALRSAVDVSLGIFTVIILPFFLKYLM